MGVDSVQFVVASVGGEEGSVHTTECDEGMVKEEEGGDV